MPKRGRVVADSAVEDAERRAGQERTQQLDME
jgi:hypothetical protein